jgi:hypothetical protein
LGEQSKSAGATLRLNLGTPIIGVKGNAGKHAFSMLIAHVHAVARASQVPLVVRMRKPSPRSSSPGSRFIQFGDAVRLPRA